MVTAVSNEQMKKGRKKKRKRKGDVVCTQESDRSLK